MTDDKCKLLYSITVKKKTVVIQARQICGSGESKHFPTDSYDTSFFPQCLDKHVNNSRLDSCVTSASVRKIKHAEKHLLLILPK